MSSESSPPPTPVAASNRRASISRQTLADLFGRSPPAPNNGGSAPFPGPIATAAANAQAQQRRRNSVSQALAGGSPTPSSPFSIYAKASQSSFGSNGSPAGSIEESAIEDGDAPPLPPQSSSPTHPFVRRVSFGARASRGGGSGNEGFDWSEQIKSRAERSTSLTQRPALQTIPSASVPTMSAAAQPAGGGGGGGHPRAMTTAMPEQVIKEIPQARNSPKKPDHFQERILKGDFYMD